MRPLVQPETIATSQFPVQSSSQPQSLSPMATTTNNVTNASTTPIRTRATILTYSPSDNYVHSKLLLVNDDKKSLAKRNCDKYCEIVNKTNGCLPNGHTFNRKVSETNEVTTHDKFIGKIGVHTSITTLSTPKTASPSSTPIQASMAGTAQPLISCNGTKNSDSESLLRPDPTRSITLLKPNSASLVFTKKETKPTVHRSTARRNSLNKTVDTLATKRHSFHWQTTDDRHDQSGNSTPEYQSRKQIKSWYAINVEASDTEANNEVSLSTRMIPSRSDFSCELLPRQETSLTNDLADANATLESASLIESSRNQIWRTNKSMTPAIHSSAKTNVDVANNRESMVNTSVSKYNRFEQLLKNLVGRKVSRESANSNASRHQAQQSSNVESGKDSVDGGQKSLPSPVIDPRSSRGSLLVPPFANVSRVPSAGNLLTADASSSSSLNSAVQRKLWSVVPLLQRESSCASLYQSSSKPLLNSRVGTNGLKKCETVLALSHSQTISSFEPIKAQNRLRSSQTLATCSRCSSILSLAANGSRYSLNLANGGFVPIKTNQLGDEKSLLDDSSTTKITCKLCLCDVSDNNITKIHQCGCTFCTDVSVEGSHAWQQAVLS